MSSYGFLTLGDMWLPDMWTEDDSYAELYYAQDTVREEAENLWGDIQKWFRKWLVFKEDDGK